MYWHSSWVFIDDNRYLFQRLDGRRPLKSKLNHSKGYVAFTRTLDMGLYNFGLFEHKSGNRLIFALTKKRLIFASTKKRKFRLRITSIILVRPGWQGPLWTFCRSLILTKSGKVLPSILPSFYFWFCVIFDIRFNQKVWYSLQPKNANSDFESQVLFS